MSRVYDNWERLVRATLRQEQLRPTGQDHERVSSGIAGDIPDSIQKTTNANAILQAADEIQKEDPDVPRTHATLRQEQLRPTGQGHERVSSGIAGAVPDSLQKTTNVNAILQAADEIQNEDPDVLRTHATLRQEQFRPTGQGHERVSSGIAGAVPDSLQKTMNFNAILQAADEIQKEDPDVPRTHATLRQEQLRPTGQGHERVSSGIAGAVPDSLQKTTNVNAILQAADEIQKEDPDVPRTRHERVSSGITGAVPDPLQKITNVNAILQAADEIQKEDPDVPRTHATLRQEQLRPTGQGHDRVSIGIAGAVPDSLQKTPNENAILQAADEIQKEDPDVPRTHATLRQEQLRPTGQGLERVSSGIADAVPDSFQKTTNVNAILQAADEIQKEDPDVPRTHATLWQEQLRPTRQGLERVSSGIAGAVPDSLQKTINVNAILQAADEIQKEDPDVPRTHATLRQEQLRHTWQGHERVSNGIAGAVPDSLQKTTNVNAILQAADEIQKEDPDVPRTRHERVSSGIVGAVPDSLKKTTNVNAILQAADEIQKEDPDVPRTLLRQEQFRPAGQGHERVSSGIAGAVPDSLQKITNVNAILQAADEIQKEDPDVPRTPLRQEQLRPTGQGHERVSSGIAGAVPDSLQKTMNVNAILRAADEIQKEDPDVPRTPLRQEQLRPTGQGHEQVSSGITGAVPDPLQKITNVNANLRAADEIQNEDPDVPRTHATLRQEQLRPTGQGHDRVSSGIAGAVPDSLQKTTNVNAILQAADEIQKEDPDVPRTHATLRQEQLRPTGQGHERVSSGIAGAVPDSLQKTTNVNAILQAADEIQKEDPDVPRTPLRQEQLRPTGQGHERVSSGIAGAVPDSLQKTTNVNAILQAAD
ncbi:hypothetical protein POM88_051171 [Heracleum sosnowskyi]|uniref:Uncharacterized protein n=1 Tax=Heracleum sosnowskyi TaxID=360622 RepID=A0AAD8M114_9APIA|nr:hypothetical protein POM88_051171 [Heracleum sosnowskyi]